MAIGGNAPFSSEIDVAVIPSNFSTPNAKLTFRVHDILLPQQVNGWGVEVLSDWIDWVKSGSQGNPLTISMLVTGYTFVMLQMQSYRFH